MAYGNGLDVGVPNFFAPTGPASDISRAYLFRITIPTVEGQGFDKENYLTAWCQSTSLPAFKLKQEEINFQSQIIRIANVSEFDGTWTLEFLLDEKHTLRAKFLAWMQAIYDPNKMQHAAPNTYKTDDIVVEQLDKTGTPVCGYRLVGAYPTEVGNVELSHAETAPSKFEVTIRYDYFTVGFGAEPAEAGGAGATQ